MRMWNLRRILFFVTIVVLLSSFDSAVSAAGRDGTSIGQRQTLIYDGRERSYVVRTPPDPIQPNRKIPLVLVLHGGGGNAAHAERMTGFTDKAGKQGFVVVYPEGTGRLDGKLLTWNAGHCCGYAMKNRVDDVGFISVLIGKLIKDYPIDPQRIYITGMSNGGMMTHRLGIELSDKIAAIAPVVATVFGDETRPKSPVSAIMINGMLDESVPYQGGPPGGRFSVAWDGTLARPALDQAVFWAAGNHCSIRPEKKDSGQIIQWEYQCPNGKSVELYLLKDNGHAWPGGQQGSRRGDKPGTSIHATDVIWEFFKAHAK